MLDSEYLNDLWTHVHHENADDVPASEVKKILEELAEYRRNDDAAREIRNSLTLDTITVERCLDRVAKGEIPQDPIPMNSSLQEAQEAITRLYLYFNKMSDIPSMAEIIMDTEPSEIRTVKERVA